MSSQQQEVIPPGQVLPEEVADSEVMDESVPDSSDCEDSEHEGMSKEVGTPNGTESAKSEDEMEVVDKDNSKVGANPTLEVNKVTLSESDEVQEIADSGNQIEDLDQYLDILMMDQTMSVAKAVKAGDVVVLVPCPYMDHKVDLADAKGVFIMDLADLVRKTRDTQLEYADNSEHLTGCVGYE